MAAHHLVLESESADTDIDIDIDVDLEAEAGIEDGWALPDEPLRLRSVPELEPVAAALDDGWGLEPEALSARSRASAPAPTSGPVDRGRFSLQALAGGELGRVADEPDFLSDFLNELLGPDPGRESQKLVRLLQRVRCLIGPP